jgi:predicted transcriptional regulator
MSSIRTDDEIDDLLNHKNNSLHKVNVQVKIIGSGNHGNQSSDDKKKGHQDRNKDNHATTAVLAELIGGKNTANLLGMNECAVSNYRNGKNSSGAVDQELIEKTEEKLGKINTKIVDKVDQLLEIFAEEKMSDLKAGEIPSSIKSLIDTHDKINRRHENNVDGSMRPQVVLYAPKQINISEYITKEV